MRLGSVILLRFSSPRLARTTRRLLLSKDRREEDKGGEGGVGGAGASEAISDTMTIPHCPHKNFNTEFIDNQEWIHAWKRSIRLNRWQPFHRNSIILSSALLGFPWLIRLILVAEGLVIIMFVKLLVVLSLLATFVLGAPELLWIDAPSAPVPSLSSFILSASVSVYSIIRIIAIFPWFSHWRSSKLLVLPCRWQHSQRYSDDSSILPFDMGASFLSERKNNGNISWSSRLSSKGSEKPKGWPTFRFFSCSIQRGIWFRWALISPWA